MGYDPGTANSGIGVTESKGSELVYLHHETVSTPSSWTDEAREEHIFVSLQRVIREFHPLVLGIEDQRGVATAARMAGRRALKAAASGGKAPGAIGFNAESDGVIEIVGFAKACARAYGVRYVMMQPKSVKGAVLGPGSAGADKAQVKRAVLRLFPQLKPSRLSSHGADALAISVIAGRIARSEALAWRGAAR